MIMYDEQGDLLIEEDPNWPGVPLVEETLIWDKSIPKALPMNHAGTDHYIERYNKIEDFVQQGLVSIVRTPIYKLANRVELEREYTSKRYRELRAADREHDDFPMPAAVPGDRARPQKLRDFAHARGLPYPSRLAENLWNSQFPSPHGDVHTHLPEIRAHYARIGDRVEKKLPGDEYIVSETAYLKWWKDHPLTVEAPWDDRSDRSYHVEYIGYDNGEPVMESGTDTHMNVPLEKFYTGATSPTRVDSEIDFMGKDPSTMTLKERAWWSGEVYRVNIHKDGMRRESVRLEEKVAQFFKVGVTTVKENASKNIIFTKARGKIAALIKPVATPSQKGAGFVGISGDWTLKYPKKQSARWTAPWYIG